MTLPASPPIKASDINVELGRSAGAAFDINGASERALAGVPSGAIRLSDFLGKSSMAADYIGSSSVGNGASPSASINAGTAAAGRRVVVAVHWALGNSDQTLNSATIGGISATIHGQIGHSGGSTGLGVALISAIVPTGTTPTLALNFSSSSVTNVYAGVWRLLGYNTLVDVDTAESRVTTATLNLTVTTAANGIVIGAYAGSTNTVGVGVTWGGVTEKYDVANGVRQSGASINVGSGSLSLSASQGVIGNSGNDLVVTSWGP